MATLAEKWLEQGFQKGMERGRAITARESIIQVLETRFGTVPTKILRRLQQIQNSARLKHLLKVAIQAPSLRRPFGLLGHK